MTGRNEQTDQKTGALRTKPTPLDDRDLDPVVGGTQTLSTSHNQTEVIANSEPSTAEFKGKSKGLKKVFNGW